jgi:hypothetical protein
MKICGFQLDIWPGLQAQQIILRSLVTVFLALQLGCAADSKFEGMQKAIEDNSGQGEMPPPEEEIPPPDYAYEKLAWEDGTPEKVNWSHATLEALLATSNLKNSAKDVTDFCPQYNKVTEEQKINFWAFLISTIAKFESDFNVTKRTAHESGSTDPVTQLPKYREGLLHTSYADAQIYKGCQFDWSADRDLLPSNSKKTIFNPLVSIKCGIAILESQVTSTSKISVDKGGYWETLNPGSKKNKIKMIKELTKTLSFCP